MPAIANTCGACCPGACVLFSDNFNRADETLADTAGFPPGGWRFVGTPTPSEHFWQILSNALAIDIPGSLADQQNARPLAGHREASFERALSFELDLWIPAAGGKVLLEMFLVVDAHHFVDVFAEFATGADEGSSCGTMRILTADGDGHPTVELGSTAIVDRLVPEAWHRVKMCVDYDLARCSLFITPAGGKKQSHHALSVPLGDDEGDTLAARSDCLIYPQRGTAGVFKFDNVKITRLKNHGGYADDTGGCPECEGPECDESTDPFDDGRIDCRWSGADASWEETLAGLELTGAGTLTWEGSQSGSEPAWIVSVTTIVRADTWGASVAVCAGPVCGTVTWPSAEGAGDGTITLGAETKPFDGGLDEDIMISLCYDAGFVLLLVGGAEIGIEPDYDDFTPVSGGSIGGDSNGGTLTFSLFEISYCPICWGAGHGIDEHPSVPLCEATSLCAEGSPPPFVTVTLQGVADVPATPTCDESQWNGAWVLQYVETDGDGHCIYEIPDFWVLAENIAGGWYRTWAPPVFFPPIAPWEHYCGPFAFNVPPGGRTHRQGVSVYRVALAGGNVLVTFYRYFASYQDAGGLGDANVTGSLDTLSTTCEDPTLDASSLFGDGATVAFDAQA